MALPLLWVLSDDHEVIPEPDVVQWAEWWERTRERIVKQETVCGYWVSTVFIGCDMGMGWMNDGPPVCFETMVFRGEHQYDELGTERYSTWAEAVEGHTAMVGMVRALESKTAPTTRRG